VFGGFNARRAETILGDLWMCSVHHKKKGEPDMLRTHRAFVYLFTEIAKPRRTVRRIALAALMLGSATLGLSPEADAIQLFANGTCKAPWLENILDSSDVLRNWSACAINPRFPAPDAVEIQKSWSSVDFRFASDIGAAAKSSHQYDLGRFKYCTIDLRPGWDGPRKSFGEFTHPSKSCDHTPVPEATSILLLGSGLVGLIGLGRARRKMVR
jgi:hypothetical protein